MTRQVTEEMKNTLEKAYKYLSKIYLVEKGDGWLTCLLCGRYGDHGEAITHKRSCWFNKANKFVYT